MIKFHPLSQKIRAALILTIVLVTAVSQAGFAPAIRAYTCPQDMSKLDCDALQNDWTAWVPDICAQNPSGSTTLLGNDNISGAMNFFTSPQHGLTIPQAVAIVGNLMQESGQNLNPTAMNPDSGAYGIAQWLGGRLDNLRTKPNYNTLAVQLDYLWSEITVGSEKDDGALAALKKDDPNDIAQMVFDWENDYERAGETRDSDPMNHRISNAKQVLALFAPGGGIATAASLCSGGLGSSPICNGTPAPPGTGNFTTNGEVEPGFAATLVRICQLADRNSDLFRDVCSRAPAAISDPSSFLCSNACLFVVENAWGVSGGGPGSAIAEWIDLKSSGHGHDGPDKRDPPIGALLFYDVGANGHVAIYLGNNTIMSTDVLGMGYIYITSASEIENNPRETPPGQWGLASSYLGWGDPIFKF